MICTGPTARPCSCSGTSGQPTSRCALVCSAPTVTPRSTRSIRKQLGDLARTVNGQPDTVRLDAHHRRHNVALRPERRDGWHLCSRSCGREGPTGAGSNAETLRYDSGGIVGSVRWLLTGELSGNARRNISERVIGSRNHAETIHQCVRRMALALPTRPMTRPLARSRMVPRFDQGRTTWSSGLDEVAAVDVQRIT